jgi:hypothetical protein
MPRFPRLQVSFALCLVWETACHRRQVSAPLPPPPAASQPASTAPVPPTATSSEAPPITTHAPEPSPYQVNKPPQPLPAAKKPARSATAPATPAAPAPTPATTPAAPPPKLGDILTADEQKQFSASIDQSLSRAQASLNSIAGRTLNKDQQAQVDQIRNFMQQAQTTRASDPSGAKSLAERADVLARDLAARFH